MCCFLVGSHLLINLSLIFFGSFKKLKFDIQVRLAKKNIAKQRLLQKLRLDETRETRKFKDRKLRLAAYKKETDDTFISIMPEN